MPFNQATNRIEALFAFVDQFVAGEDAKRSHFDQIMADFVVSVNALAVYLEGLTGSGADQRFLGRLDATPTERLDTTPLQEGDFYIAGNVAAGRLGLVYVYDGTAFQVASDFASIGTWFRNTLSAANSDANARSILGLGTAATQNSTAFASAATETNVALALKLLADGIAKQLPSNDWNNAHLAGPGTTMVAANAAASNAPVALNLSGLYVAYDTNNGFLIAAAHADETLYYRVRALNLWGLWRRLDIAALAALSGTGIAVRTGADAWALRNITSTDGSVTITNPGGVGGNIDLATTRTVLGPFATTSGTSVLVTGIPSWANTIIVALHNGDLTLSTGAFWRVQIGPPSGVETTGYVGASTWYFGSTTSGGTAYAAGFDLGSHNHTLPFQATWVLRRTASTLANGWVGVWGGQRRGNRRWAENHGQRD